MQNRTIHCTAVGSLGLVRVIDGVILNIIRRINQHDSSFHMTLATLRMIRSIWPRAPPTVTLDINDPEFIAAVQVWIDAALKKKYLGEATRRFQTVLRKVRDKILSVRF